MELIIISSRFSMTTHGNSATDCSRVSRRFVSEGADSRLNPSYATTADRFRILSRSSHRHSGLVGTARGLPAEREVVSAE